MSVPIIAGAGSLKVGEVISRGMDAAQTLLFVVGFATSAAVGYVTIRFLLDRKSTRLNSSHANISYAVFCLKKKKLINLFEYFLETNIVDKQHPDNVKEMTRQEEHTSDL